MEVLHRIGWSVQVPARRAPERDEATIALLFASCPESPDVGKPL
jgi:hypothetical protein